MRIYTKTGDEGETGLFGGGRVGKDDLRVAAYGDVDELNSFLGWTETQVEDASLSEEIREIQRELFTLGADLASPDGDDALRLEESAVGRLEARIDCFEEENEPLRKFILPGGSPGAAAIQICRTVCRRAERSVVGLSHVAELNPATLIYLNRLSDLLFVMARWLNRRRGVTEPEWEGAS